MKKPSLITTGGLGSIYELWLGLIRFLLQFDEELLRRQEAQAQLGKYEEKIAELQTELQACRTQVYDVHRISLVTMVSVTSLCWM